VGDATTAAAGAEEGTALGAAVVLDAAVLGAVLLGAVLGVVLGAVLGAALGAVVGLALGAELGLALGAALGAALCGGRCGAFVAMAKVGAAVASDRVLQPLPHLQKRPYPFKCRSCCDSVVDVMAVISKGVVAGLLLESSSSNVATRSTMMDAEAAAVALVRGRRIVMLYSILTIDLALVL
jgi:hypothetical protein